MISYANCNCLNVSIVTRMFSAILLEDIFLYLEISKTQSIKYAAKT